MNASVTPAEFLNEMIEPLGRALNTQSARALLEIKASEAAQRRIAELAQRCNQGQINPAEQAEYELLVEVGDIVAVLQARARRFLSDQAA